MSKRRTAVAGTALSAVLLLGACSGGDGGRSERADNAAAGEGRAPAAAAPASGAAGPAPSRSPGTNEVPATEERKLVLTAEVRLESDNPEAAAANARSLAIGLGGMVGGEQTQRVPVRAPARDGDTATPAPDRYTVTSSLTLKVPPDRFDTAIEQLSALGTVVARNRTATDVTEQVVDVTSRVETQRRSVDRVRELLAKAESIQEIVSLESELTRREAELDSLLKRQQSLSSQTDLATIAVTMTSPTPGSEPADKPDAEDDESFGGSLADALKDGWDAFVTTVRVILTVAAVLLPFLIVALVLWLARRRFGGPLPRALADRRARRREAEVFVHRQPSPGAHGASQPPPEPSAAATPSSVPAPAPPKSPPA